MYYNRILIWFLSLVTFLRKLLKRFNQWFYNRLIWNVYIINQTSKRKSWFLFWYLLLKGKYGGHIRGDYILVEYYLQGEKYITALSPLDLKRSFFPIRAIRNPKMIVTANLIGTSRRDIADTLNRWLGPSGDFHINKFSAITTMTWGTFFALEGIDTEGVDVFELMDNSCDEKKFTINKTFLESVVIRN